MWHVVSGNANLLSDRNLQAPRLGERVQAAVVLWADGDADRLRDAAALAHQDWRDVLVRAGLADDDWRERLDAALSA